jgi:bacterioferritin-associated ferredoxin
MIVCSCNVLSDYDVRHAVNYADNSRRNAKQIYGCLGCDVECGRCVRTIKGLIDEALRCDNAHKLGSSVEEITKDSGSFEQQTLRANSAFTKELSA